MRPVNKVLHHRAKDKWLKIVNSGVMKCSRCNIIKPLSEFRLLPKKEIDKRGYVAYTSHCNICDAKRSANYKNIKIKTIEGKVDFLFSSIRRRCKDKGYNLDFDKDHLILLWNKQDGRCYYTNIKMNLGNHKYKKDLYNLNFKNVSVDRVDSRLGYTKDNVVLCCWGVNNMKQQMSYSELVMWSELIFKNAKNG
jgi:hypothetical protein